MGYLPDVQAEESREQREADELLFQQDVALPFEEAVDRIKAELKKEGFGVLTEIDVQKTLQDKIGVDFRPYLILGACNAPFRL